MAKQNLKELAMLDVAEIVLKDAKEPLTINQIFDKVAEAKEIERSNFELLNQFYTDMVASGKFVYCDNDLWDLKENNLELWDKESYSFADVNIEEGEEIEDIDFTEFILPDSFDEVEVVETIDDEDEEDNIVDVADKDEEEDEYIEVELDLVSTDDDDVEETEIEFDDDFDEEDYDDIMDDYEDMYDE
ncbi:DNA-directed RNA polymerase subunit delta [Acholeplasma sp. OttesenSCG-928-E16]|nr:DNA-directed RNA polymerase subunit delta [Acholeplasma sp. OttesenSCG-928-E16]